MSPPPLRLTISSYELCMAFFLSSETQNTGLNVHVCKNLPRTFSLSNKSVVNKNSCLWSSRILDICFIYDAFYWTKTNVRVGFYRHEHLNPYSVVLMTRKRPYQSFYEDMVRRKGEETLWSPHHHPIIPLPQNQHEHANLGEVSRTRGAGEGGDTGYMAVLLTTNIIIRYTSYIVQRAPPKTHADCWGSNIDWGELNGLQS